MKIAEILEINIIIKEIIENPKLKMDSLTKFKLLGIMKKIEPTVLNFQSIRDEKIREYGKPEIDKNGNKTGNVVIAHDNINAINAFNVDLEKVLNSESDLKIELKSDDIFDKGIPADYLMKLYDIIVE